jgi:hypothetical protein
LQVHNWFKNTKTNPKLVNPKIKKSQIPLNTKITTNIKLVGIWDLEFGIFMCWDLETVISPFGISIAMFAANFKK